MQPRRELTGVDLRALVDELGNLGQPTVRKAYLYDDGMLRFRLRDPEHGRRELIIETGRHKRVTVADPAHVSDAPERPPNFARMLRNRLRGAHVAAIHQHEFDRIVVIRFERDDDETTVVAELFGDGNAAVLDSDGTVVDCLREIRLKSRRVAPGSPFEFPESRVNPFAIDRDEFLERMRASDTDIVRTMATQLNMGGAWGEELCTRAGVEKGKPIESATDDDFDAIFEVIRELDTQLSKGDLEPCIYEDSDGPVDVSPVELVERSGLSARQCSSFNEAVDTYFYELTERPASDDDGSADKARDALAEQIAEYERIITHQERALDGFAEEAAETRRQAELLYREYDLVDEVIQTVREARADGMSWEEISARIDAADPETVPAVASIVRVDSNNQRVILDIDGERISVDPSEGVEHNADRLYQEAKAIEEKRTGAIAAIEDTKASLEAAKAKQAAKSATATETEGEAETDWLSRSSIPIRRPEDWYERFRWFHTTDGFLVIGGRDAHQNEELVEKYLETGDLFVHAQAHGGPATVLKATGPSEPSKVVEFPDSSLEQAAQFAVSYSSVWKAGQFSGDAYIVEPHQVTKHAESGEYLETGAFAIRGERDYHRNVPVGTAIGITCEPTTRVIGGPPAAIEAAAEHSYRLEPGRLAKSDAAKRLYRHFREDFADTAFVRKVASVEAIQQLLPPGGSRILED